MAEQLQNFGETTLNEALDASETGIDVVDGSVFPATGDFRITIDDEIMLCTSRTGNTLTVTRGAESTTAATHDNGASVYGTLTAASLEAYVNENAPAALKIFMAQAFK